ncbi:MAG: DUF4175 family protein [Sphingobacteriales bacterium]|nr:DUF4175 family protein [Sphingobacteriales bacterium]
MAYNNYQLLIEKLDRFIRKYYLNKLIRGTLYTVGLVLAFFLLATVLEYNFYFSTTVRKVLFWSFVGTATASFAVWVLNPLLHYFRLGRVISHEQAASIIGTHFTNVKDKLLNILQLKAQAGSNPSELLEAGIDQKIDEIKLVPFRAAIDLGKNRQYLKYALVPFAVLLFLLFAAPSLIKNGANRLINNNQVFEREAPFSFKINNENLEVAQYEDFLLEIEVDGNVLPNEAFINLNNYPYKLKKIDNNHYTYQFNKVQQDIDFHLESEGFPSNSYTLKVLPKPAMLRFSAALDYPAYTGKADETLNNSGDLNVPVGTKIRWSFEAQNTDKVQVHFGNNALADATRNDEQLFSYSQHLLKDARYTVFISNDKIKNADSVSYFISVTPDLHPTISVQQYADSTDNKMLYFLGEAGDDYGISRLALRYQIQHGNQAGTLNTLPVAINGSSNAATFNYNWDLQQLNIQSGDKLTYYFEVWDNDGVNGAKSTKSQVFNYALPSVEQLDSLVAQKNEEIQDAMQDAVKEAKKLQKEVKDIQEKLVQKKELDWQDREKIQKTLQKHEQLQQNLENLKNEMEKNNRSEEQFKEMSENIQQKKEQVEKMMNEVLSDEMKEMMQKLQELLDQMKNEETMEKMEDMKISDEQLQRELERMEELMKQLEMEQKMEETIEKLNELAEKEEKLSEETEQNKSGNLDEQEKKQEELNEEFEKVQEEMKKMEKMQEELKQDTEDMKENQEQSEEIEQEMQESSEQLEQNQSKPASQKQQSAAQKMKKMANKMQTDMQEQQQQQQGEDMKAVRQLLENLITMSKDQEDVMNRFQQTTANNPGFVPLVQEQFKLNDDFQIIEDSLIALSKRVFQIESFVLKELSNVDANMKESLEHLGERKIAPAAINQQYVMTSTNNLALMLEESLQQMQQQQMSGMPGSGSCDKPGGNGSGKGKSKKNATGMRQMQEALNKQLEEMMKGKDGQAGKAGKDGKKGMSKELAQAAAQQQAIRNALRQLNEEQNKDGKKQLSDLEKLMDEMEKTEKDIVNRNLSSEMIKRQQDILTRLLEAEKAEREREMDNKRESNSAQERTKTTPPEIEEYLKKRQSEVELYKTVPPSMKSYYKKMVEEYFKSINF